MYPSAVQGSVRLHLKRLIIPVYTPMTLVSIAIAAPSAAFPQYLGGLGATVGIVGLVLSFRAVGNLISDLPGGILLGRYRIRSILKTAIFVAGAASLAMVFVQNIAAIAALILLTGIMSSVVITAMMTYVRLRVPPDSRGRALSLVGGAVRIGGLVGPLAGGILADRLGFQRALLLRAILYFAAFVAIVADRSADDVSPQRTARTGEAASRKVLASLRTQVRRVLDGVQGRGRAIIFAGTAIVMLQVLRASREIVLPLWGDHLGLSATLIGSVMSAGAALDLALFIPSGLIMDGAGRKVAAGLCIGLFSCGMLLLGFTTGVPGFFLASLVMGFGNGFGAGINMTMGTDLAPDGAVSEFIGIWRLFGDVGAAAGPSIIGLVAAAGGLVTALLTAAAIGFVGLIVLLVGPETLTIARQSSIAAR